MAMMLMTPMTMMILSWVARHERLPCPTPPSSFSVSASFSTSPSSSLSCSSLSFRPPRRFPTSPAPNDLQFEPWRWGRWRRGGEEDKGQNHKDQASGHRSQSRLRDLDTRLVGASAHWPSTRSYGNGCAARQAACGAEPRSFSRPIAMYIEFD